MRKNILLLILIFYSSSLFALDVIFRYDDFRLEDDKFQAELIETFAEEQVPLHIAVIPCKQDSSYCLQDCNHVKRVKELQKQGILQIALHGFCHGGGGTVQGEFLGKSYDEQRYCLERGNHLIDSVFGEQVHIFIPPWNRYNQNTLDILSDLGYSIISADIANSRYISDPRFQYYPEGIDHPRKLAKVLKYNARREGLVVCMFHRYDINDEFTMVDLATVLRATKATIGVHITTMDEICQKDSSYNEARIRANLVHPLLTKIMNTRAIILPIMDVRNIRLFDLFLHLMLFVIIAWIGMLASPKNKKYIGLQGLVILLSLLCIWQQWLMPKLAVIVCTGIIFVFATTNIILHKIKHA